MAGAQRRRRPSRRAAARPGPSTRDGLRRRPADRRRRARPARRARLRRLPEDLGRSRHPHLRPDRAALDVHRRPPRRDRERQLPDEVTTKWWKEERGERVFVDYNQNARDRTIASPYSVRPKPGAPVSAPLDWDEVADVQPEDFTVETMPARFADVGDRFAEIDDAHHSLEALLEMYERDEAEGRGDMPYPPDYPKMPGEPKRVQPSRDRDRKPD